MGETKRNCFWILRASLLVAIVLFGVRWSSGILQKGVVLDEQYIVKPINALIHEGWSIETAIDFEETKGPSMIWQYAFFGKLLGGSLNDLRLVSVWSSIFALVVLAWIAVRSSVYRSGLFFVAIGWLLIPYNLVFSELVMGEVSFLLLSLLAVASFIWGNEKDASKTKRILAPILYCIAITFALHSRIHVVALTGGVCITAFVLNGTKSWPWWVASIVAGSLRIPLWVRWGGLVSPEYQALHGLGFRLESLAYLSAALVPFVGVFAIEGWRVAKSKAWIVGAFVLGVSLMYFAMPDLTIPPGEIDLSLEHARFQGFSATLAKTITSSGAMQQAVLALLSGVGLAGLAGLRQCKEKANVTGSITFWSLTFGLLLYSLTRGFVFDRFLLTWASLLPIVWFRVLPKWLLIPQFIALAVIAGMLCNTWL